MAFIHALAAAMVTSFIARACRDGQLASCGCSRGSRPKQLHDDWTWGGCGDNLEFAYKFAVDFIDVREKETRRGTRGAGNPERKRGRFHQRRNQQMQQTMQADDASAAGLALSAATTLKTIATTTTTTTTTTAATPVAQLEAFASENEYISSDKENMQQQKQLFQQQQQQQQQISNKTVSVDGNQHSNGKNDAQAAGNNTNMSTATLTNSKDTVNTQTTTRTAAMATAQKSAPSRGSSSSSGNNNRQQSNRDANADFSSEEEAAARRIKPEDLLELQERITKEILNSKLQGKEMQELQEKINREILNTKVFNMDAGGGGGGKRKRRRKNQRAINGMPNDQQADATANGAAGDGGGAEGAGKWKNSIAAKARSLMNLHNNEAGRRAVLKKTRITCKCHGVSGSCSLITCWQQLSSIREIGDYLREKYEEATVVKLNKRGRLQVKDTQYKMPTSHDLVYLDESPDWCRNSRQLQWPGTHGRVCNKTSAGLDGCGILCCGRGYNTKNIVVRERCNCKFHWCCQVKCDVCVKVLEEHTCK